MIKEARKNKGLTQKELAHMLHIDQSYISKLERGVNTTISAPILMKICNALDLCPILLAINVLCPQCQLNCNVHINIK